MDTGKINGNLTNGNKLPWNDIQNFLMERRIKRGANKFDNSQRISHHFQQKLGKKYYEEIGEEITEYDENNRIIQRRKI